MPDTDTLELREAGLPGPPPPPVGDLPAGGARWPVPPHQSYIGLVNLIARSYRFTHDEALRQSRQNAEAMENDLTIEQAVWYRIAPVAQLGFHLEAEDETDPRQARAVEKLTKVVRAIPDLQGLRMALLRAVFPGRSAAQLVYEWDFAAGDRRMVVRDWRPIHGDKLVFRWGGDVGILVNSTFAGPKEATDRGYAHFLSPADREAVLVHRHERRDRSFYQPEQAGGIEGSGIRDRVYWYWFLKTNFLALLSDYADRFANGIWEAYYDKTNPTSKSEVEAAVAAYRSNRLLLWPRGADGATPYGLRISDVGTANPGFLLTLVEDYLDRYIRLYILGQEASTEVAVGIGGDAAGLHADTLATVQKYDAVSLDNTLNRDLMPVLCRYNCPDCPVPPRYVSDIDRPDGKQQLEFAQVFKGLGLDIDVDHLYAVTGFPKPRPGAAVLSGAQPLSPAAVGQTPDGVPVAGPGGPEPQAPPADPGQAQPPQTGPAPAGGPATVLDA